LQLQAQLQDMQALVQQQQQQVPGSSAGAAAGGPRLMQAATSMPTAYGEPFETQIPNYLRSLEAAQQRQATPAAWAQQQRRAGKQQT
jgi:hypothetical protein